MADKLTFVQRVNRRALGVLLVTVAVTAVGLAPVWGALIGSLWGDWGTGIGAVIGLGVWVWAFAALLELD